MPRRRDPARPSLDQDGYAALLERQSGVCLRQQLVELGATDSDLARLVRRRELVRLQRGVYVDHTGSLTAAQRNWAAVLANGEADRGTDPARRRAALADESALAAASRARNGLFRRPDKVRVAVDAHRGRPCGPDTVLSRVSRLDSVVLWNASPPRMRPEVAALRVASRSADDAGAVAVLTDVIGGRLTTAQRLSADLELLPSLQRRGWLGRVVGDLVLGTSSVLEHTFLVMVERSHGLPGSSRQVIRRRSGGVEYRDVEYDELGLVVELDGKAFHEGSAARDRDLERDLDDHVDGKQTVRLGWGQVVGRPCQTAQKLAVVMQRRGWRGRPRPCGPDCAIRD